MNTADGFSVVSMATQYMVLHNVYTLQLIRHQ